MESSLSTNRNRWSKGNSKKQWHCMERVMEGGEEGGDGHPCEKEKENKLSIASG